MGAGGTGEVSPETDRTLGEVLEETRDWSPFRTIVSEEGSGQADAVEVD